MKTVRITASLLCHSLEAILVHTLLDKFSIIFFCLPSGCEITAGIFMSKSIASQ